MRRIFILFNTTQRGYQIHAPYFLQRGRCPSISSRNFNYASVSSPQHLQDNRRLYSKGQGHVQQRLDRHGSDLLFL